MSEDRLQQIKQRTKGRRGFVHIDDYRWLIAEVVRLRGLVPGDTTRADQRCAHSAPEGFVTVHHVRCTRCGSMGTEGTWPEQHDELLHSRKAWAPAAEDGTA